MILTQKVGDWWVTDCHSCGANHVRQQAGPRLPLSHHRRCAHMIPCQVTNLRWVGPSYIVRGKLRFVGCFWHKGRWNFQLIPRRIHSSQYGFEWRGWGIEIGKLRLEFSHCHGEHQ